jgi:hypothetical protein
MANCLFAKEKGARLRIVQSSAAAKSDSQLLQEANRMQISVALMTSRVSWSTWYVYELE